MGKKHKSPWEKQNPATKAALGDLADALKKMEEAHSRIQKLQIEWQEAGERGFETWEGYGEAGVYSALNAASKGIANRAKIVGSEHETKLSEADEKFEEYDQALKLMRATQQNAVAVTEIQVGVFDEAAKAAYGQYTDLYNKLSAAKEALQALHEVVPDQPYKGADLIARKQLLESAKEGKEQAQKALKEQEQQEIAALNEKLAANEDTDGSFANLLKGTAAGRNIEGWKGAQQNQRGVGSWDKLNLEQLLAIENEAQRVSDAERKVDDAAKAQHKKAFDAKEEARKVTYAAPLADSSKELVKLGQDITKLKEEIAALEDPQEQLFKPTLVEAANEALRSLRKGRMSTKDKKSKSLETTYDANCKEVLNTITSGKLKGQFLTAVFKGHVAKLLGFFKGFDKLPKMPTEWEEWTASLKKSMEHQVVEQATRDTSMAEGDDGEVEEGSANLEHQAEGQVPEESKASLTTMERVAVNLEIWMEHVETMQCMGECLYNAESLANLGSHDIEFAS